MKIISAIWISVIGLWVFTATLLISCSNKKDSFFAGALALGEPMIVVSGGGVANSLNTAVSLYDIDGNFLRILHNYAGDSENPRGLAVFDPFHLIVAVDGTDRLDKLSLFGGASQFGLNVNLTGNIFDIRSDSNGNFFVVESNTIERFDQSGNRFPPTGATPYINTTLGACVLSTPHGLTINSNGHLVAVSSGNHRLKIYDVSGDVATCVGTQTYAATGIWDIVQHPNGYMYFVTQTTDALYRVNADGTNPELLYQYTPNTVNPGAITVLPDGNLIVATHGTNQIDLFDEDGVLLQPAFIRSNFTIQVSDLLVIGGQ